LLYERYENLNKEELFIVGFIPRVLFLPRRQALQVASCLAHNTTKSLKKTTRSGGEVELQMFVCVEGVPLPLLL
jgi:hypothetical protein